MSCDILSIFNIIQYISAFIFAAAILYIFTLMPIVEDIKEKRQKKKSDEEDRRRIHFDQ